MAGLFTRKKIRLQINLGEKLTLARKRKNVNLEEAERDTKIAMKYIYALEHSKYDELPADVYVYGFLNRYANYLEIKTDEVIKMFDDEKRIFDSVKSIKRHSDQENKNLIKPKPDEKWLKTPKFFITPELVISVCVGGLVVCLLGYIWFQVKSFAAAPPLEIKNQDAEIVVSIDNLNISGATDPGATLTINGEAVSISADGNFSEDIQLVKGINKIEIIAKNKTNKETKKTIQVLSK